MIKRFYRISYYYLILNLIKILNLILSKSRFKILPDTTNVNFKEFSYCNSTRRLVLYPKKNYFNKIILDSSSYQGNLCDLGRQFETNKSPYNLEGHRSGYTCLYELLFSHLKNKKINFAEIGIEKNSSIKMWRNFFKKAKIFALEYDKKKILKAKKHNLININYVFTDVSNDLILKKTFSFINKKFDIIIDDSTHRFNDQINIIKNSYKYLKKNGGMLLIEDIRLNSKESLYYKALKKEKKYFKKIFFIETKHINNFTANYRMEKLLVLIK